MPKLIVHTDTATHEIPFAPGATVRGILEGAGLPLRTACRGNGACGLCLVQVESGETTPPTHAECLMVSPEQLARHLRLACQLTPGGDLGIRLINTVATAPWRELSADLLPCAPAVQPHEGSPHARGSAYGLALDVGTTQLSLTLRDLQHGQRLAARLGVNPQCRYGADVLTRLMAADESCEQAQILARLPLDAVAAALREIRLRDGINPQQITRVIVVGNTSMLVLLAEADPRILLHPRAWTRPLECTRIQPRVWVDALGIHNHAAIEVVPPLAGFVGSDLLAGVVATRLSAQPGGLLLDFGTNSELALWDGQTLHITSTAGGPAFESSGISCGMPAEPGAIFHVDRQQDIEVPLQYQVIGGKEARGVCGSGFVDLIACLRDAGVLTRTGSFADPKQDAFVLQHHPGIRLRKRDVDLFQRAKAAVGVGIGALLDQAHMHTADLQRICVCGVFGHHVNIRHAQRVGLLPQADPARIELCGNTALAGAEWLLLSPEHTAELASLRDRTAITNLAQQPDFEARFLENLYLEPMSGE